MLINPNRDTECLSVEFINKIFNKDKTIHNDGAKIYIIILKSNYFLIFFLLAVYFRGFDNLIATARSNKVAVCLGFQYFNLLKRNYDGKETAATINTVSGQIVRESAKILSKLFG
jgi:hypothetical protein